MLRITLDTNVLFQAVYSKEGASHAILRLIRDGEVTLALSVPVFVEYQDVLLRPRTLRTTRLSVNDMEQVLDFIAFAGRPTPIDFLWRPNLRDESDNIFVELAVASDSRYLITRNVRDYVVDNQLKTDSFKVATPHDFLRDWRNLYAR